MKLSIEQEYFLDLFRQNKNIFLTGLPGTGKTTVIRHAYKYAMDMGRIIHVTAMTGCAAQLLGCNSSTLHSFANIGVGIDSVDISVKKIKSNRAAKKRWVTCQILVVDEISMLSSSLFHKLEEIARRVRNISTPFGGIQLVFSGDFAQLPPIVKSNNTRRGGAVKDEDDDDDDNIEYCFKSPLWNILFPLENHVFLKTIFRQKEREFTDILHEIRTNTVTEKTIETLMQCIDKPVPEHLSIVRISSLRATVNSINMSKLAQINKSATAYDPIVVRDHPVDDVCRKYPETHNVVFTEDDIIKELEYIRKTIPCGEKLTLKVGAQVMNVVNNAQFNLWNGSMGVVVSFEHTEEGTFPKVMFDNCRELTFIIAPHVWTSNRIPHVGVKQIPLILSYAITIHKTQGASLKCAILDLGSDIFETGQMYVALSRIQSLDGVYLTNFDPSRIYINKSVCRFYKRVEDHANILFPPPPKEDEEEVKEEEKETEEKPLNKEVKEEKTEETEEKPPNKESEVKEAEEKTEEKPLPPNKEEDAPVSILPPHDPTVKKIITKHQRQPAPTTTNRKKIQVSLSKYIS